MLDFSGLAKIRCAPNSKTYFIFKAVTPVAGKIIHELLDEAYDNIQGTMDVMGDRLIQGLGLDWAAADFSIRASNANNHQITMGVLGGAIDALRAYVLKEGAGNSSIRYLGW